jgi:hypothetical protein
MRRAMRRFAVIDCEDNPAWGTGGFGAYMLKAFREEGEDWVVYKTAVDGSLPEGDAFFDGFVLTGSHHNVRDNCTWQQPLVQWLRSLHVAGESETGSVEPVVPRVLGICYGHQIMAHALGGEVDTNPDDRFVLKTELVRPTAALAACAWARGLVAPPAEGGTEALIRDVSDDVAPQYSSSRETLLAAAAEARWSDAGIALLASHGDCVRVIPPHATYVENTSHTWRGTAQAILQTADKAAHICTGTCPHSAVELAKVALRLALLTLAVGTGQASWLEHIMRGGVAA